MAGLKRVLKSSEEMTEKLDGAPTCYIFSDDATAAIEERDARIAALEEQVSAMRRVVDAAKDWRQEQRVRPLSLGREIVRALVVAVDELEDID